MKYCPYCRHAIQRWGRTAAGTARFFCPACGRTTTNRKRQDVRERHLRRELGVWLGGKDSLTEIAERHGETRQTFWKHLRPLLTIPFESAPPTEPRERLILDATYIHKNELCALIAIDEHERIFWRFAPRESYQEWYDFLRSFPRPKVVVMDGQKGLFLAARTLWPRIPIQRCQFHIVSFCTQYTGRQPRDPAPRAILDILYELKYAKSPDARDRWILLYKQWEQRYDLELYERNVWGTFAHPRLRSVRYIIRKALPNLFTFLDHPGTPNTTNLVEGWVNTAIAEAVRLHRGLKDYEKKVLASIVLTNLNKKRGSGRTASPYDGV